MALTFSKNRDRLLEHEVAPRFFAEVVRQAKAENRCGLIVDFSVDDVLTGERAAALRQLARRKYRHIQSVAGDKGYCTKDFVAQLRQRGIRPHIAFKAMTGRGGR